MDPAASAVRQALLPLRGGPDDFVPLLERIGDARFVLLGEATHGTHEFYRARARITQRLIVEKGFHAIALEADWPDAYRVNRWVQGIGDDGDASDALDGFSRFPQWMWRNADVLDFVGWLRAYNDALHTKASKVSVYGLDLYSLYGSIEAVLRTLEGVDHEAAERVRARYACFEHFGAEPHAYAHATSLGMTRSCEREAIAALLDLRTSAGEWLRGGGPPLEDAIFEAEQNARVVRDAEEYYRNMLRGDVSTWNLRDRHMATTLDDLAAHLDRRFGRSKIVVWEHNSHLGDARATAMSDAGEWNVGQLARERYGSDAILVGFTTYDGSVTAASSWDAPAERLIVRPALTGSYEALFHEALERDDDLRERDFLLVYDHDRWLGDLLRRPRLERAIGVVYMPESERVSHYFSARLADQFDAIVHFDRTRAVEPLERTPKWLHDEPPETYPFAL